VSDSLRILLELEPDTDPVRGRLHCDGSQPRRFDGYVQLIGLLESLAPRDALRHELPDEPPEANT
jgi:hypothetical protein